MRWWRIQHPAGGLQSEDYLLLAAIVLLPWAFGGVEIWAYRTAAFLLAAGAAVSLWRAGWAAWGLERSRWLLPAFLLAAWAALQIVPLPPFAIRVLSPTAYRIYSDSLPGYSAPASDGLGTLKQRALEKVPEARDIAPPGDPQTAAIPGDPESWSRWRSISLQPTATLERLMWYLALLMAFLVIRQRVGLPERSASWRAALFGVFAILALFGLLQMLTGNGKIYWCRSVPTSRFFGPYVDPSHFAGVMEMAVPWLAAYAWNRFRCMGWDAFREARFPLAVGASVLCVVAGLATASRMGAVLIGASLSILLLVGLRSRKSRWIGLGCLVASWGLMAVAVAGTPLGRRIVSGWQNTGEGTLEGGRLVAWKAAMGILREFALTGTGFGTFREVFPRYMPAGETRLWGQLHNDYLEVLLEGGIVAGVLLVWLVVAFTRRLSRERGESSASRSLLEIGLLLGIASLAVHALVEFNHQVPANALLFVTLCSVAESGPRTISSAPGVG